MTQEHRKNEYHQSQGDAANESTFDPTKKLLISSNDVARKDDSKLSQTPEDKAENSEKTQIKKIDAWELNPQVDPWTGPKSSSDLALPRGLITDHQIADAVRLLLDAPADMPDRDDATLGLCAVLAALEVELPSANMLRVTILERGSIAQVIAANDANVVALDRRKRLHLIYSLVREIGFAIKNGRKLTDDLLKLTGVNCVRMLLSDYQPSASSIAKLRNALLYENVKQAQPWTTKGRAMALNKARLGLNDALEKNPRGARDFGLASTLIPQAKPNTKIEIFNAIFRRRVENLIDFATMDAVASAGGYDTLSVSGLLYAGQQVLNMVLTGDRGALVVSLEVISHLTSDGVLKIPLKRGEFPPLGALAWLDLESGIYSQVLYRIREQGAKVEQGMEHHYAETTQAVSIHLSPPFHKVLVDMDRATGGIAENVEGLTGPVGHSPRSGIVKRAGYRITARRMQESLPTLLIQEGYHRWPVALATNSHFLVTRGRRSYGACRSESIDRVIVRAYQMLGWTQPTGTHKSDLVGTPTVARDESISQCLNYLCDRADRLSAVTATYEEICLALQANAAWLAMLSSLAFALRRWLVYDIKIKQIVKDEPVKFNDKDVHEHQGPGIPVVTMMRDAVTGWVRLCHHAIALLRRLADAGSLDLANRLEKYLANDDSEFGIVTIDALGNLKPVGYKTWHDSLPQNIRLKPNFSRQFWPLKLMDRGVDQVVMDLLMRHQLDSLPPGTSRSLKSMARSIDVLRTAMEVVMASLNLRVPLFLQGDQDGQ